MNYNCYEQLSYYGGDYYSGMIPSVSIIIHIHCKQTWEIIYANPPHLKTTQVL